MWENRCMVMCLCVCASTHVYADVCFFTEQNKAFWIHLSLGWNMHYSGKIGHSLFSAED